MKKVLTTLVIASAMFTVSTTAFAEGQFSEYTPPKEGNMPALYPSVGPVMAESVTSQQLPEEARQFIHTYFPDAVVVNTVRDLAEGEYEVDLDDGTDLEFNSKGQWIEVEAGHMRHVSPAMVKALIPEKAYSELDRRNMVGEVEKIKRNKHGFKVELREVKYDDYRFATDGRLLSVND